MKNAKVLSLEKLNEKKISLFGSNFIIKDGKVYLVKKYKNIEVLYLMENDAIYFLKLLSMCDMTKYSSHQWIFIPTREDWKYVRKNTYMIILPLTPRCNSNCNICFMRESIPFNELSKEEIEKILFLVGKNKRVLLFGGEPTIRKDIFEIIKLVIKSGNEPQVYTNGLKLADEAFVKKMKESGVKRILLSFDGFREDTYEKLRGNREHLYLKLKALKNLEKYNIEVYLSVTIAPDINEDELPKILKFAIRNNHFIKGLNIYGATPGYGRFNISMKRNITSSDIAEILEKASSGVISKEYFIEFKRLRVNLSNLLKKFGIFFPPGYYYPIAVLNVINGEVKQFIPLEKLKRINYQLENKRLIPILKDVKLVSDFLKLLISKSFYVGSLGKNMLVINIGNIITPVNYIPIVCCFIAI
jgi:uncharacterized radical SAM superfamily Fe-S cluster-containing enzyme